MITVKLCVCTCVFLTVGLGQVLVQLLPVVLVQDVVHAGVDQLLLFVLQVLRHIVRHEHDASLSVHHEQEAVQSLRAQRQQVTTAEPNPRLPVVFTAPGAYLQKEGPQVVLVDDALARRGHVRLLDVIVAGRGFSCGEEEGA